MTDNPNWYSMCVQDWALETLNSNQSLGIVQIKLLEVAKVEKMKEM